MMYTSNHDNMSFFSNLFRDIAIDLGTANTLIFIRGQGVVLNEPSIVARERNTGKIVAIGRDALLMHEKTHPGIVTIRPLANGVIADYEATEELIKGLINKTKTQFSFGIRRMVIGIPSGITEVEKRAVRDSAEHVGAREVYLVTEPMAAAIGIGLDVKEPMGNMIVISGAAQQKLPLFLWVVLHPVNLSGLPEPTLQTQLSAISAKHIILRLVNARQKTLKSRLHQLSALIKR